MHGPTLKQGAGKELKKLCGLLAGSIPETLGSLIGRELVILPGELEITTKEELTTQLSKSHAIVRGALDKDFAGRALHTLIEVQDALAMTGLLMMTPEEVIEERRKRSVLEGEDLEAFGELGNVLCSGFGNVLRANVANVDLRLLDHGVLRAGEDPGELLPEGPLVVKRFKMRVALYPETVGRIVVDLATAEAWNKGVLETVGAGDAGPGASPVAPAAGAALPTTLPTARAAEQPRPSPEDENIDDVPAAPIRGAVAAYLAHHDLLRMLRRSCRRAGLELTKHGRAEIPNPAAHRNAIVLLDVPAGEERRFDWCRRIKEFGGGAKVMLLLHRPSRARVAQAFLSQADAILGLPCEEVQLSQKLVALLEGGAATTGAPASSSASGPAGGAGNGGLSPRAGAS